MTGIFHSRVKLDLVYGWDYPGYFENSFGFEHVEVANPCPHVNGLSNI